jgi:hypothetical protein
VGGADGERAGEAEVGAGSAEVGPPEPTAVISTPAECARRGKPARRMVSMSVLAEARASAAARASASSGSMSVVVAGSKAAMEAARS